MTERGNVRRDIVQKRYLVSTEEPSEPRHRVTSQKSVFVQPKQGYIDPNEAEYQIVYIPVRLKTSMLECTAIGNLGYPLNQDCDTRDLTPVEFEKQNLS